MQTYPTQYAVRRRLADLHRDGVSGTTTSGTDATSLLDTARGEVATSWPGAEVIIGNVASANAWVARRAVSGIAGDITVAAFPATIASASPYEILQRYTKNQYLEAVKAAVEFAKNEHWVPWLWDTLIPVASTYDYAIPAADEISTITIDAGSTTAALVDAATTNPNDYWNGARMIGLTGANAGEINTVSDWTLATNIFAFSEVWPFAVAAGDTFTVIRTWPAYIEMVEYIPSGSTYPITLAHRDWDVIWRGVPYLRFHRTPPISSTVRVYGVREPLLPSHDMHPVEAPPDVVLNYARYKLQISSPRRADLKLDDDATGRPELFRAAQLALSRHAYHRSAFGKRVR